MKKLRQAEFCPLHRSFRCTCRQSADQPKPRRANFVHGVKRIEDHHHPRGYREVINAQEKRKRKHELLAESQTCFYCSKPFEDYRDIELCHKEPKGSGGARHDDHRSNLCLGHSWCNSENGSRRPA